MTRVKKKFLPKKIEEASINIKVEKGRISIAGRDYHTSHAYLKGCDRASIEIYRDSIGLNALFDRLPEISEENGAIIVYDKNYVDEKIINDTFKKINKEKEKIKAVLIPLKLRIWGDKDSVQIFIDDNLKIRSEKAVITVNAKSIINFITWPFPAVWVYVERANLDICQDKNAVKIKITGL